MKVALKGEASVPFRIPPGVTLVRVNPKNGQRVGPGTPGAILEPFKMGTEPGFGAVNLNVVGGESVAGASDNSGAVSAGTGGLY